MHIINKLLQFSLSIPSQALHAGKISPPWDNDTFRSITLLYSKVYRGSIFEILLLNLKFSAPVYTGPGVYTAFRTMGTGSLPQVYGGRGMT
jgi:hypothetical protein